MGPVRYLHNPNTFTLPIGLWAYQQQPGTEWDLLLAVSLTVMIRIIVLFFLLQRYLVQCMALSGRNR